MNKKQQKSAFIIHGFEACANCNFFPWLSFELQRMNYKVILKDMPDPFHPDIHVWTKFLNQFKEDVSKETIVIGHSLGGSVAPYFVSKLNQPIKGLFLAAPTNPYMDRDKQRLEKIKEMRQDSDIESVENVVFTPVDWEKVIDHTQKIIGYFSTDDPWIDPKSKIFFDELKIKTKLLEDRGHLLDSEFPELLADIKKLNNLDN
jgi:predicted alpha/beta hydrolase family esterase